MECPEIPEIGKIVENRSTRSFKNIFLINENMTTTITPKKTLSGTQHMPI